MCPSLSHAWFTCNSSPAIVPGALLHLDASDNPGHEKSWKNLGEAGGELLAADEAPVLEEGKIEETISGLLPGVYSVIAETGNSEIRIDGVSVEPKKITILNLGDN